jgi:multidrug efflux pump subunit AcrA (membrane-fusion protein)
MLTRYVLPLIAICTLAFAIGQMVKAQQVPAEIDPPIEPGKSPYTRQLAGAGIIEPETENISIGSHLPGVVDKVFVKVGQTVHPGDALFQLDDRQLKAELKVRQANVLSAEAMFEKVNNTPRKEERPGNLARVAEAEVNLKDQTLAYDRVKRLLGTTSISEEEATRRAMAVELAKAQLDRARADFKLWEAGAWEPDRMIARAAVELAQAQLKQTEVEIARLTTQVPNLHSSPEHAPTADPKSVEYKVLQINIRPGEFISTMAVNTTPLIVLGYVGKLHVRVDIDENDIARFKPGLTAVAKPRGNPNLEFPLKFVRVDPYVIPKRSLTGANTERVDTRVLQVIYEIDTRGKSLFVGQQVDVFIQSE